ncbi:uncharacterized protein [Henckelia pumila]|uniref:uncharacterized protein n=1 Tax=Henckelia pumila TaxID=405737 RepID=UPI003C6E68ED
MAQHSCCNKQMVKRGLWSPEEDEKLIKYITTYGHGCWSSVPKFAGLQRCGKSCRLRWINYLRPDLKRGSFTRREAAIVIELHRILGNRWAQISKHLPGRTDNEVKNFWNSSIKKKFINAHQNYNHNIQAADHDNMVSLENPCEFSENNLYMMNAVNINNPNPNSETDPLIILQGFDFAMSYTTDQKLTPLPPISFSIPATVPQLDSAVSYLQPLSSNLQTFGQNQHKVPNNYQDHDNCSFMFMSSTTSDKEIFSPNEILQQAAYLQDNIPILMSAGDPLFESGMPFSSAVSEGVLYDQCDMNAAAPPHHIDYVESLMAAFTSSENQSSATSDDDLLPPLPCSGPFHVSPSATALLSCWDEL